MEPRPDRYEYLGPQYFMYVPMMGQMVPMLCHLATNVCQAKIMVDASVQCDISSTRVAKRARADSEEEFLPAKVAPTPDFREPTKPEPSEIDEFEKIASARGTLNVLRETTARRVSEWCFSREDPEYEEGT